MPLPLLPLIGLGLGALGLGKGVKAVMDNSKASDINATANDILDDAKKYSEVCRKGAQKSLEAVGSKKVFTLNTSIGNFLEAFEKLHEVNLSNSAGLNELKKFQLDKQSFQELKELNGFASSVAGGIGGGALSGALVAFGAYSGVMTFGATAAGTAIATLKGVAATNATLAFLGGGSLAVGGLGVAGGTMVLGGLIAAPALAVMGFIMGSKASANLENANSNLAEAKKIAEEIINASFFCNSIRRRCYMYERLLIRLDTLLLQLVYEMEETIVTKGVDFYSTMNMPSNSPEKSSNLPMRLKFVSWWDNSSAYTQKEKNVIAKAASLAKAIKSVIDTPILTDEGRLTDESERIIIDVRYALGDGK